jgi:hypothetical protein
MFQPEKPHRAYRASPQNVPSRLSLSSRWPAGRASRCLALLAVALLAAACGSSGESGASGGSGGGSGSPGSGTSTTPLAPPLVMAIAATPPDIPSSPPACGGYAGLPQLVPSSLASLVSVCVSPAGYTPDEMVIYNLSDDVLDVSSAQFGAQPVITPHYPSPDGPLPEPDDMEIYAQNAAVAHLQPGNGTTLLPVGGYVVATQATPMLLNVRVDFPASNTSYGAQLMTGYVVDNLVKALPEDSAASYEVSIAECVNAAYSLWTTLNQQPDDTATNVMYQALQTVGPCQELQQKVAADKAEEIAVAAEADRLGSDGLHSDLAKVAETAGEDDWESGLEDVIKVAVRIAEEAH